MQAFTTHSGHAAVLPGSNIDTDQIVPARFLVRGRRDGFADALFADLRGDPGFVLNTEPACRASVLVAGDNFGCGSSREHAVWSLVDFGFRALIAPSFADIFFNNATQNGLLAIVADASLVARLSEILADAPAIEISIDLPVQQVQCGDCRFGFEIAPSRKEMLLNGLSETASTLRDLPRIERFERDRLGTHPWLAAPRRTERTAP
jgi:3-isopropylmalate/(R)-2-methylmalate dehydratase small subunit